MGLVFEPMAISKVVLKEEEIQRGVILVDMGADSVNIYDYEGGKTKRYKYNRIRRKYYNK